jgi:saccharopine dehydrogenase (NAD+, L-lysine-forming)
MLDCGIRREDKNCWERRAPLTPAHVAELIQEQGLSVAVQPAHAYRSVDEAEDFLATTVGRRIRERGTHPASHPLVVGFTGGGNVSQGAQEVFDRLPNVEISPEELPQMAASRNLSRRAAYKVVFRREHRADFARYLPYLTILVNGICWEPGQPRLVSRADLQALWASAPQPRLRVLADISCDVNGSIEATVRTTDPADPVFVYDPLTGAAASGVEGRGPVVLAVDNLLAELPRDASEHFGDSLFPFLASLAAANYQVEFEMLALPAAILGAVVTQKACCSGWGCWIWKRGTGAG